MQFFRSKVQFDAHPMGRLFMQIEVGVGAVKRLQPQAQIGQSGAGLRGFRHAGAGVADPQHDRAVDAAPAVDLDAAARHAGINAMLDGVLHQRQQRHRGEAHGGQLRQAGDVEVQPVRHPQVHQFQRVRTSCSSVCSVASLSLRRGMAARR
jgi:hypothetical protein